MIDQSINQSKGEGDCRKPKQKASATAPAPAPAASSSTEPAPKKKPQKQFTRLSFSRYAEGRANISECMLRVLLFHQKKGVMFCDAKKRVTSGGQQLKGATQLILDEHDRPMVIEELQRRAVDYFIKTYEKRSKEDFGGCVFHDFEAALETPKECYCLLLKITHCTKAVKTPAKKALVC